MKSQLVCRPFFNPSRVCGLVAFILQKAFFNIVCITEVVDIFEDASIVKSE